MNTSISRDSNTAILGEAFIGAIRQAIRQEITAILTIPAPVASRVTEEPYRPFLNIKEAADTARVSASTIRLYIRKGQLKAGRFGRRVVIARADLEGFVESKSGKNPSVNLDRSRHNAYDGNHAERRV